MTNVQYGCGLSAPDGWINFDTSPTLRLQRLPLVGGLVTRGRVKFPVNVRYGDVTKGLPIADNYCDNVYASHVLEHLSLNDFHKALAETLRILKPGGVFRAIVPDLADLAHTYLEAHQAGSSEASLEFMTNSCLGLQHRQRGLKGILRSSLGNSEHLWMWDEISFSEAIREAGFSGVRRAYFGDSAYKAFASVEDPGRFQGAVAVEAIK